MKRFSKSPALIISAFVVLLMCNSCLYVGALIMSIETKETTDKWKSGRYKTRIQRRAGWAGPYTYYCRVKEKKPGGLYYHKIINDPFSNGVYSASTIKFPLHKSGTDTIAINMYKKEVTLIK